MFKKLFMSFLLFAILIVGLFSFLIITTNDIIFKQVLGDKESQYQAEVEQTLDTSFNEVDAHLSQLQTQFKQLAEAITENEKKIVQGLEAIQKKTGSEKASEPLATVTDLAEEIFIRFNPQIQFIFMVDKTGNVEYGYPLTPLLYVYPISLLQQFPQQGHFENFLLDKKNNSVTLVFGLRLETNGKLNGKYITAKINLPSSHYNGFGGELKSC
jgi:hypothetical protein